MMHNHLPTRDLTSVGKGVSSSRTEIPKVKAEGALMERVASSLESSR